MIAWIAQIYGDWTSLGIGWGLVKIDLAMALFLKVQKCQNFLPRYSEYWPNFGGDAS
jgi:hypothetical protein